MVRTERFRYVCGVFAPPFFARFSLVHTQDMYGVLEALEFPRTDDCIVQIRGSDTSDDVGSSDTPSVNNTVDTDVFPGEKPRQKKSKSSKSMGMESKKIAKRVLAEGVTRGWIRGS